MFRIPVNQNQTVDNNVKVEDQMNVDAESSESDGKVNEECLHAVLNDQRVGPVESASSIRGVRRKNRNFYRNFYFLLFFSKILMRNQAR